MLRIAEDNYCALRAQAEQAYPDECCGVLLGRRLDGVNVALEIRPAQNADSIAPRSRYAIAAEDLIAAQKQARALNLDIVGFYHSHPDHSSRWSESDLAEAHWTGCSYVITAVQDRVAQHTNSYRLAATSEQAKQLVDEEIEIVPRA